jgi:hypothetical protein
MTAERQQYRWVTARARLFEPPACGAPLFVQSGVSELLRQPGGLTAQTGSRLAFLMHFLRFLAFALPLNFF